MMQDDASTIIVYCLTCLTFPVSYSHAEDVSIAVDARTEDVKYELQVGSRSFQMGTAVAGCAENRVAISLPSNCLKLAGCCI